MVTRKSATDFVAATRGELLQCREDTHCRIIATHNNNGEFIFDGVYYLLTTLSETVGENKVGNLTTVNRDVGSDNIKQIVDMHKIIVRMKPDLLIRLKSVATGAA